MLRLPTMRAQSADTIARAEREDLSYAGFLAEPLMAECEDRDCRRAERRIRAAHFPREKSLRDFGCRANPNVDPAVIHNLATCDWITKGYPLCLIGDAATGKSHLLIALGTADAMAGHRVRYTTAAALVNELFEAADDKQLGKTIARYGRVDLLEIDELGYLELDRRGAEMLFQVLTEREEKQHRDRLQRGVHRLVQDLHRPAALRGDRGPAHLQRHAHRNRPRVLPPGPHQSPPGQAGPPAKMKRTSAKKQGQSGRPHWLGYVPCILTGSSARRPAPERGAARAQPTLTAAAPVRRGLTRR